MGPTPRHYRCVNCCIPEYGCTGLFFRVLPRYTLLTPYKDLSSTRGKKITKDQVSLVVCANLTGSNEISYTLIGKPKKLACIVKKA